ncbi:MAG TPA: NfeD family protein, partial [Pyrinomonadaceae bacterium]
GRVASVERALDPEGFVLVRGELWRARSRRGVHVGRGAGNVRVVGARDCVLEVEPLDVESLRHAEDPAAPRRPS